MPQVNSYDILQVYNNLLVLKYYAGDTEVHGNV